MKEKKPQKGSTGLTKGGSLTVSNEILYCKNEINVKIKYLK